MNVTIKNSERPSRGWGLLEPARAGRAEASVSHTPLPVTRTCLAADSTGEESEGWSSETSWLPAEKRGPRAASAPGVSVSLLPPALSVPCREHGFITRHRNGTGCGLDKHSQEISNVEGAR